MTYHCRPSEILQIPDEWAAYQIDVAACTVGQGELNQQQKEAMKKGRKGGKRKPSEDAQPMPSGVLKGLMG